MRDISLSYSVKCAGVNIQLKESRTYMEKAIRVVCAGSSGGGKTTLTRALSNKHGREACTFSRPTAAARIMGYDAARNVKPEDYMEFQWLALIQQISAENEVDYFLGDRSVLDFAGYAMYQVPGELESSYLKVVERYAKRYDAIIFVPSPSIVEDNGIRHTQGMVEVQNNILALIERFNLTDKTVYLELDQTIDPSPKQIQESLIHRVCSVEQHLTKLGLKL